MGESTTWRAWIAVPIVVLVLAARAVAASSPGVLIIHSNQRPTPADVVIEDTLRTVVAEGLKRPVDLYSEYLDDEWVSVQRYGAAEADFLRDKYGARDIRVIVVVALPALLFAKEFRARMFAGVPVVHLAVARDRVAKGMLAPDVIGHFEDHDPTPTLQLAFRLHPGATRLVLIRGGGERDRLWDSRLRAAVERLGSGLEIEHLTGLPTADVLKRVSALTKGTIVFTPGYFVDGAGQVSSPRQSVERIGAASAVPVYGTFDTLLGSGIVGGYMTRYEDQAKDAGAIVVRLLNGTPATDIAPSSVARVLMVDWRQVQRWGIDERALPPDTHVRFREPTAWSKYWREISIGIAILLIQAGLIVMLLFQRRSRQRTATALEESQKRMNLAARAAKLSSWIRDASRGNAHSTAQPRRPSEPAGERPRAFERVLESTHPADREDLERAVRKALATGEELDVEYRVVEPNGDVRWVAARGRAEKDDSQRLLGVALDVTERKASEIRAAEDRTALRHMARVSMAGQLSAAVAHQLNQPLAAILGNAEAAQKMLRRPNLDLVELQEICDDIVSENRRAADVIRRLGELYRRGEMKIRPVDLNELIRQTLELIRTELIVRHVIPVVELAPALPLIEGEPVQLQQVVLNLVLNAADAMSGIQAERRRLLIRTEASDTEVRLQVVDRGTGIAPDHLKILFDPFWSTKAGGMGMGLAICHSIVTAHRGSITASNNAEGGATFCVSLPIMKSVSP